MLYYGFFDAINSDRRYDSKNFSDYFDGIISDGIYASVGKAFNVSADGTGLFVNVGTGRAKILNRYVLNTSILQLDISAPDSSNYRYDAIIVRVSLDDRTGSIEVLTGTPSTDPQKPTPSDTETKKAYVLAYVKVPPQATAIAQENIENNRGAANCPWVAGLVDTSNIINQHEQSLTQTRLQIDELVYNTKGELSQIETDTQTDLQKLKTDTQTDLNEMESELRSTIVAVVGNVVGELNDEKAAFQTWFDGVQQQIPQRVQKYTGYKETETSGTTDFEILSSIGFDISRHAITVYKNGVHLIMGHEYTIDTTVTPNVIRLYSGANVGDVIAYDVVKIE